MKIPKDAKCHCVYVHRRACDGTPFYVGAGRLTRAYDFRRRGEKHDSERDSAGGAIVEILSDRLTKEESFVKEQEAIARLRSDGENLVNQTVGGAGSKGLVQSPETRAKRSLAMLGSVLSPETRAKISKAHKGRVMSPEWIAKISAANTGKKHSYAQRAAQSLRTKGRPKPSLRGIALSQNTKQKISEAGKASWVLRRQGAFNLSCLTNQTEQQHRQDKDK